MKYRTKRKGLEELDCVIHGKLGYVSVPLPGSFSSENVCVVPGALSNVTREIVVAETADAVAKISADAVFIVRWKVNTLQNERYYKGRTQKTDINPGNDKNLF